MKMTLLTIIAPLLVAPVPVSAEAVTVLGQVVLDESKFGGEKIGEFSALVRDPDGQGVIAVSDRGYLARLDLEIVGGRLTGVVPVAVHVLTGKDGQALRDQDFNPEAAALLGDATLAIASETGPRLAVFDSQSNWLRDEVLPDGVADASVQASAKDGIEALAWTPADGFIAVTEEPQAGTPRHRHTLYSTGSGSGSFSTGSADSVSIKGMETDGDQLILLERTRDDVTQAIRPWLRRIDLGACLGHETCASDQISIGLDGLADADFEGLVALGGGKLLMVSDDKIDGDLRSVFVLVQIGDPALN